ncbi:MAG: PP2C family protein-serine/threonine phosphatase, partial [Caldilinea sp.]
MYKSWSHSFGSTARRGSEALFVLLLESVEPLPTGSKLLAQVGEAVRKALGQESIERHTTAERMYRAIQSANDLLLREQTKTPRTPTHRISVMLAALMPAADAGCEVVIAHVGACRAFLRRNKHIEPLTVPHTWGQENVMSGIIDAKDEDDEGKYPYWRRPTRYLGVAQTVAVDFTMDAKRSDSLGGDAVRSLKLQRSDSLLLCSSRLTAASLSREAGHIDAGSASALARQLTDRAAMPSRNGAAAVVVTWSNGLQPFPVAVGAIALGVLVLLAWGFISSSESTGTSTVTASPTNGPSASPDSPTPPTDTPGPTEGPSLTPTSTATSTPMPTSTATPTSTELPPTLRSPTATPAPTATSTPTAPPTSTSTTTATVMPTPTADEFVVSEFQVVLLTPSPDLTVKEQNKTVQ